MKKLFSKRSGFTLVEIIIAFAIFAIMASMIVQILNLMVQRKMQNKQFEDKLSKQEQTFVAKTKDMTYTAETPDGQLRLQFKDNGGADVSVDDINYQLKNWDDDDPKNGINYFAGDYEYELELEGVDRDGEEDDPDADKDEASTGGSTQMSRFDTRLTGTKGLEQVQVSVTKAGDWSDTPGSQKYSYNVSVTVYENGDVDEAVMEHSQVSLFFAENKANATPIKVVAVNDNVKDWEMLKKVKRCGDNGVNVHVSTFTSSASVSFTIELEKAIDASNIGFGQNAEGDIYKPFTVKDKDGNETTYVNIYGAYQKGGDKTEPATPEEPDTEA